MKSHLKFIALVAVALCALAAGSLSALAGDREGNGDDLILQKINSARLSVMARLRDTTRVSTAHLEFLSQPDAKTAEETFNRYLSENSAKLQDVLKNMRPIIVSHLLAAKDGDVCFRHRKSVTEFARQCVTDYIPNQLQREVFHEAVHEIGEKDETFISDLTRALFTTRLFSFKIDFRANVWQVTVGSKTIVAAVSVHYSKTPLEIRESGPGMATFAVIDDSTLIVKGFFPEGQPIPIDIVANNVDDYGADSAGIRVTLMRYRPTFDDRREALNAIEPIRHNWAGIKTGTAMRYSGLINLDMDKGDTIELNPQLYRGFAHF